MVAMRVLLVLACVLCVVSARPIVTAHARSAKPDSTAVELFKKNLGKLSPVHGLHASPIVKPVKGSLSFCNTCLQLANQALNELVQIVIDGGVLGGCAEICSKLPNQLEAEVCNLLCDAVGVEGFLKALDKADLDTIYFCELVKTCPVLDCPASNPNCVSVDDLTVQPAQGQVGTTFTFTVSFTVSSPIGTGEMVFQLCDSSGNCGGDGQVFTGMQPGKYSAPITWNSGPDDQGNEPAPGQYSFLVAICEGECGSKHPHSQDFGFKQIDVTLTQ